MKRHALFAVFLCLFSVSVLPKAVFPDDPEKDALLASLVEARDNWIQNASFYGNITIKDRTFSSEEEALNAGIDEADEICSGFECKWKNKYRRRVKFDWDDAETSQKIPVATLTDKVANDRFGVAVTRWRNRDLFSLPLGYDGYMHKLSGDPGASFRDMDDVCSAWWFCSPPVYKGLAGKTAKDCETDCARLDDGRVLITVREEFPPKREEDPGLTVVREILIRTDTESPLVEQVTTFLYEKGGEIPSWKDTVKVSEWGNCGGFDIPVRLRMVLKLTNGWEAVEWRITDLGRRQPTDEDFKLEVGPEDKILHLKQIPESNIIDIDALTDDDYDPDEEPESAEGH